MGLLDRLLGRNEAKPNAEISVESSPPPSQNERHIRIDTTYSLGGEQPLVKLAGTTTFTKEAINVLAGRHGVADGGYLELDGTLQREPDNQADPHAVAVYVEGERIGYLPGYTARSLDLSNDGARAARVQFFTEVVPKGLRAEAWAWLADGSPEWEWSESNRPPMSSRAKAEAHHADVSDMVTDALADGGERAEQFKSGMVNGVHYLQLVEPIKQLKRDGRLDEALTLCYAAIEGAEAAARRDRLEPAPWYSEQAAIIHRKLQQREQEVAVLKRWLAACPPERREGRIQARLDNLLGS